MTEEKQYFSMNSAELHYWRCSWIDEQREFELERGRRLWNNLYSLANKEDKK